jgi:hypothetical protein
MIFCVFGPDIQQLYCTILLAIIRAPNPDKELFSEGSRLIISPNKFSYCRMPVIAWHTGVTPATTAVVFLSTQITEEPVIAAMSFQRAAPRI